MLKKKTRKPSRSKTIEPRFTFENGVVVCMLPLRVWSAANLREHPMTRARRVKKQREAAIAVRVIVPLPVVVRLTRIAPRALDGDNLQYAFKALRDGIADRYGVKDNDPRIRFEYDQRTDRPIYYGVEVTIRRQ